MSELFSTFRKAVNHHKKVEPFVGTLLALDPGETTGWALFETNKYGQADLVKCGQQKTWPFDFAVGGLTTLLESKPNSMVYETYHIYAWLLKEHEWSAVATLQIIGCAMTLCHHRNIPVWGQSASIAKTFCTDQKLRSWGFWQDGQKHARDAIRHGCYYLLFGESSDK